MEEAYLPQGYHLHCPFKSSCKLNFHPACHHQGWASWNWTIPLQQDPAIQPTCCDQGTTGTDDTLQLSPAISAASLSRLGTEVADGLRQGWLALLMSKISPSASLLLDPTYILAFPSSIAGFHRFKNKKHDRALVGSKALGQECGHIIFLPTGRKDRKYPNEINYKIKTCRQRKNI